ARVGIVHPSGPAARVVDNDLPPILCEDPKLGPVRSARDPDGVASAPEIDANLPGVTGVVGPMKALQLVGHPAVGAYRQIENSGGQSSRSHALASMSSMDLRLPGEYAVEAASLFGQLVPPGLERPRESCLVEGEVWAGLFVGGQVDYRIGK